MRSRFTAFALGLEDYLLASWHPGTRPERIDLDPHVTWRRLQVVDVSGDVVEFRASYRAPEGAGLQHERSRFAQLDRRWLYVDGEIRQG